MHILKQQQRTNDRKILPLCHLIIKLFLKLVYFKLVSFFLSYQRLKNGYIESDIRICELYR